MKSKYTKYIIIPFFTILTMQYLLAQNPIIRHVRTADPSAHIWDDKGTLWIYTSGDPNDSCSDYSTMDGYRAFSTTDMVNYTDHGVILHSSNISWGVPGYMFAPTFAYKNGKYYCIYPHAYENSYAKFNCGVAVSDVPQGPFTDIGIIEGVSGQWIDPCVFTDTDGTSYLYWGINEPKVAKLKDNMTELAEEPRVIEYGSDNFFEAIYMHKKDDIYYFSYNTGKGGYYAMGDNPYGPFDYKGAVNPAQEQDHHSMIEFKGQWYFFYHVHNYNGGSGCMRNTCAEYLFYNADRTLKEVYPSSEGVAHVDAPVIRFTSPTYDQKFKASASVMVDVDVTDDKGVSKVKLYLNGELVDKKRKSPYTWGKGDRFLSGLKVGNYTLKAIVVNKDGRIGERSTNFSIDLN